MSMALSTTNATTIRSIRDRTVRAQRAYAVRLRDAIEALQPLLDENDSDAAVLAKAVTDELAHIRYGSALVEE